MPPRKLSSPFSRRDPALRLGAKARALAAKEPSLVLESYGGILAKYADRISARVERLVLPHLGEPVDFLKLSAGLDKLNLDDMAEGVSRNAVAAHKRLMSHAQKEAGRILGAKVPVDARFLVEQREAFVERQIALLQKAGQDQIAKITQRIRDRRPGEDLRSSVQQALWVSRERTKTIAKNEVFKTHRDEVSRWFRVSGSTSAVIVTRRDERVRHSHRPLHGLVFPWEALPAELNEVNCRCRPVALELLSK